jgi:hypothetical protein
MQTPISTKLQMKTIKALAYREIIGDITVLLSQVVGHEVLHGHVAGGPPQVGTCLLVIVDIVIEGVRRKNRIVGIDKNGVIHDGLRVLISYKFARSNLLGGQIKLNGSPRGEDVGAVGIVHLCRIRAALGLNIGIHLGQVVDQISHTCKTTNRHEESNGENVTMQ